LETIFSGQLIDLGQGLEMIRDLPPGSHVAVCVASAAARRAVQAAFLADGLSEWLCVYAAQDESLEEVRRQLESAGFPPDADPSAMRWIRGSDLYGDPARPDFERWTTSVGGLFADARQAGRRGLRWTGDLPIAFARRGLVQELRGLEESVASQFPGPYTILCTYEEFPVRPSPQLLAAFAVHSPTLHLPEPATPGVLTTSVAPR
jgi:hypothetical protein